jgi:phenylacetate-CoA ligase
LLQLRALLTRFADPQGPCFASSPSVQTIMVSRLACGDHVHGDECRYRVAWAINPHMRPGAVSFEAACRQHASFVDALVALGACVVELPFVHGAYDSVFVKDVALLIERRALLAHPRYAERERELASRGERLRRHGFEVVVDASAPLWEGGDVVALPGGNALFLGYGFRSDVRAARWLERRAGVPVIPLQLVDEHLYHLDTALAVLPDGTALACRAALTPDAMRALEHAPGIRDVLEVSRDDALAFGLNILPVGDTVIASACAPAIERRVAERGYRYHVVALDQFHLAGGGAACLTAIVHRDAAPSRRSSVDRLPDIYGAVFRSVVFPAWETHVRRRPVVARWRELERSQWSSLDELTSLQASSLVRLVRHAYDHVPLYRDRWRALDITPDDIRTPDDLRVLPILRRADLQHAGAAWASTEPPFPTIRKQTSGTSGEPLLFGYEPDSEHWRRAVKYRGYAWAGYRPGDRALHFWGAPEPTPPRWPTRLKIAVDRSLRRDLYMPCAVMSDDRLLEVVRAIQRTRPSAIVCYAQAGAELARFILREGLRTWRTIPVICGAERVLSRDRADLELAFGPAVFDTYGCREVMMIGAECEAHAGLHVAMENVIVEIVVTEDGGQRLARDGETGEVVVTDLHNLAMPFIRYANGDIATAGSSRPCACKRALPRIEAVQGRISELLHDGSGAVVSGVAVSFLVQDVSRWVRQFQAVQHRDRSVTINMVVEGELPPASLDAVRRNGERLLAGVDVHVAVVSELPRNPSGKHRLVVVER